MEAEIVLNLIDSYWFDLNLFTRKPLNNNHQQIPEIPSSNPEIPTLPTIHTKTKKPKSKSKSPVQKASSIFSPKNKLISDYSASPNSVLSSQKLQTIFSGKVSEASEDSRVEKEIQEITASSSSLASSSSKVDSSPMKGNSGNNIKRRRQQKKKGLSKSLSDLEFEEIKGFIDLGFVFSEEDKKDSNLVNILPGLQRFGDNNNDNNNSNNNNNHKNQNFSYKNENENEKIVTYVDKIKKGEKFGGVKSEASISRPYLSESWEILEKKKIENYLMNWRVPEPNNQVQMKDNLRIWAHTVASTVR